MCQRGRSLYKHNIYIWREQYIGVKHRYSGGAKHNKVIIKEYSSNGDVVRILSPPFSSGRRKKNVGTSLFLPGSVFVCVCFFHVYLMRILPFFVTNTLVETKRTLSAAPGLRTGITRNSLKELEEEKECRMKSMNLEVTYAVGSEP